MTMSKAELAEKYEFLQWCQFIRMDSHARFHWVFYQRSKTLEPDDIRRFGRMKGCIRCGSEMTPTPKEPYCAGCKDLTIKEEEEWDREERREQRLQAKAEAEKVKAQRRAAEQAAAREAQKNVLFSKPPDKKTAPELPKPEKKKPVRVPTVKDRLIAEDIKKTKPITNFLKVEKKTTPS